MVIVDVVDMVITVDGVDDVLSAIIEIIEIMNIMGINIMNWKLSCLCRRLNLTQFGADDLDIMEDLLSNDELIKKILIELILVLEHTSNNLSATTLIMITQSKLYVFLIFK